MFRAVAFLPAVALGLVGCARPDVAATDPGNTAPQVVVAPADPHPPAEQVAAQLPVAPHPRAIEDIDLTNQDINLDPDLGATIPQVELQLTGPSTIKIPGLDDPNAAVQVADPTDGFAPGGLVPGTGAGLGEAGAFGGRLGAVRPDPKARSFGSRSGETKTKLLKEYGGSDESERAVALGLAWLSRQQKQDGGWEFDGSSKQERVAATGLALLAFLGAGETHKDARKYKKTVEMGLQFLVRNCPLSGNNAGRMSVNMYAQGIGTLALAEAYGMTQDNALRPAAQAAVNHIQRAQGPNGSWGYQALSDGDTSIVGWQIQALHAAKKAGLMVDDRVIKRAVAFLDTVSKGARKAEYGYRDNMSAKPGTSLTAVGLWCRCRIDGWTPANAGLKEGVEGLLKRPIPTNDQPDMYFCHYAAQVVRDHGGDAWKDWFLGKAGAEGARKGGVRDTLVAMQDKKDGINQGSWAKDPGQIGSHCGRVGTTALSVIALEAPYREFPLGTDVKKQLQR